MKLPLLLKQMMVRTGAIVIVKAMGLIGRILMTRLIGAEGIGIFQIAYSFYGLTLMVITGGLPTSLAIFTARHPDKGWIWFKIFSVFLILIGAAISILTFWHADHIAEILGNTDLYFAIRCIAPAIFAVPLLSLLRGYLQGLEHYGLIAISELVEQLFRVLTMLLFTIFFLSYGPAWAAGGSMLGALIGALVSFMMLIVYLPFSNQRPKKLMPEEMQVKFGSTLIWFFHSSLIISFTRLLVPLSDVLDAIIIPNRIQAAGFTPSQATAMFGVLTGMAVIVVYMPTIVTAALSHTQTVKLVSEWREGLLAHFYRRTRIVLEAGWVWGCVASIFLFVYSRDLSSFIFATPAAGVLIKYLAAIPLLVGLREVTTSILWAQERKQTPFIGLIIGICCAIILHYFLIPIPEFTYKGAAIGILTLELIALVWNAKTLLKQINDISYFRLLLDLLIIAGIMGLVWLLSVFTAPLDFPQKARTILGMFVFGVSCLVYIYFRFIRKYKIIT